MKNFTNYISYVPRSFVIFMSMSVLVISAIAAPIASNTNVFAQDSSVRLEADTKIRNLNDDNGYQKSVDAMVDDVVQIQVWYHNMEDAEGSAAKNLKVGIDIPSKEGKSQTITSTVDADNAKAVTSSADVNLSLDNAHLEYIPFGEGVGDQDGGAQWRHNQGAEEGRSECLTGNSQENVPEDCYVSEKLGEAGDQIVNGGMVIEEDFQPSFEFESTITVLARVKADAVKVNKYVRNVTENPDGEWKLKNEANPGDKLEYMIRFENKGNKTLNDVMVGDNLPKYTTYVEGSTELLNMNSGDWKDLDNDNVTRGGINVGHYEPNSTGYVKLKAEVSSVNVFEQCGTYTLKNVGVVRPKDMNEFYNTAHTDVEIDCEVKPEEEKPEQPEEDREELPVTGPGQEGPDELPNTGIGGTLAALFGSGALGVGVRSWFISRRKLLGSLLGN